jgi:hypothetical protein
MSNEFRIHVTVDDSARAYLTAGETLTDLVARWMDDHTFDVPALTVTGVEEVLPGRLPGDLDKRAFAHMLQLLHTYRAALKDTDAHDHREAIMVTASFVSGAMGLYAALTGQDKATVHAALVSAADS